MTVLAGIRMSFDRSDIHALYRLIYYSDGTVSLEDRPNNLRAILQVAVPRNKMLGVSGALLACDKWFMQALEGDRLTVGNLYQRIRQDPLHGNLNVIMYGPIDERKFGGWSMCGRTLSPTDNAIVSTLENNNAFNPVNISKQAALKILGAVSTLKSTEPPYQYL